jgi:uncharacterized protein
MIEVLHSASVMVFQRYLMRLAALLDRAERHCDADPARCDALLAARLAPDMLPLRVQVEVVSNFALRAAFLLAGLAVPDYGEFPADFAGLRARLARTQRLLSDVPAGSFVGAEARSVRDRAGEADVNLPAPEFLFAYALPNFFFHLSMAYAIMRSHGVDVGKADFDGYHRYSNAGQASA